ncbi:hypothetical protein AYO41_03275 [Verrucomicrobia bacterium SCGC AG-212-E04]|nr:hypothetical protein AYO41_03275 [Verrucomicrobia bacterium SCGC AG-212-E04]
MLAVLMMVAVGLELEWRHFRELARRKFVIGATLLAQAVILPLLGWIITRVLHLPSHVAAGLLLVAACPIGDIANFYVLVARANLALGVTLNAFSCLLSVFAMTMVFAAYDHFSGGAVAFEAPPAAMILRLVAIVAVPILGGMTLRRWRPRLAVRLAPAFRLGCLIIILPVLALVIVVQGSKLASHFGDSMRGSMALLSLAAAAGFAWTRLLRLSVAESVSVTIVFPVRNIVLAVTVAVTVLQRMEFAGFALFYFLLEAPVLLTASWLLRRRQTA